MSNADLGCPTHYIPVFYQQSTFIVLEPDAIVSGYKIPFSLHHHCLYILYNIKFVEKIYYYLYLDV